MGVVVGEDILASQRSRFVRRAGVDVDFDVQMVGEVWLAVCNGDICLGNIVFVEIEALIAASNDFDGGCAFEGNVLDAMGLPVADPVAGPLA